MKLVTKNSSVAVFGYKMYYTFNFILQNIFMNDKIAYVCIFQHSNKTKSPIFFHTHQAIRYDNAARLFVCFELTINGDALQPQLAYLCHKSTYTRKVLWFYIPFEILVNPKIGLFLYWCIIVPYSRVAIQILVPILNQVADFERTWNQNRHAVAMKVIPHDSDTSSDVPPASPYSRRKPRRKRPPRTRSRSMDHMTDAERSEVNPPDVVTRFDASVLLATPVAAQRQHANRFSTSSAYRENVFNFDSAQNSPYSQRYPATRFVG